MIAGCRRGTPLGEACGSSQRGEPRALALAAAIRELVVTTDPLVVKILLRGGGDSLLFCWRSSVNEVEVGSVSQVC